MTLFDNFHRQNLQNQSLAGLDLTGADFSYADIRGVDFTNTNLTGANFYRAKAGLTKQWAIVLSIAATFLAIIAGVAVTANTYILLKFLIPKPGREDINSIAFFIDLLVNFAFWATILRQGIKKACIFSGVGLTLAVPAIAILAGLASQNPAYLRGLKVFRSGNFAEAIATGAIGPVSLIVSLFVAVGATIALVCALSWGMFFQVVAKGASRGNAVVLGAEIFAMLGAGITVINRVRVLVNLTAMAVATVASTILVLVLIFLARHVANRFLAEDEKYAMLRPVAIAISARGGTNFKGTNLTDANFIHANLSCADFRFANLDRTCWRNADKLKFARLDRTILIDSKVRKLLVSGDGREKSYIGADLRGANLVNADLNRADFKRANLSEASLQGADLGWANLTEVQAIATDFTCAQMTGVRLESWNINSDTQLEGVESKFVYLLENPKPGTDDSERRPCSGEFATGEFTKLFQEVTGAIDFIFHNGIEWKPFLSALKKVKVENNDVDLTINSIENKGDGVVVIKIDVPPETNKYKIHEQFQQFYQETQDLEGETQQQLAGLEEKMKYVMSVVDEIVERDKSAG